MSLLQRDSVRRVQTALREAGSDAEVVELTETAHSAEDAAASIGCELGQIVKSLVFAVDVRPVMALVAGDRRCRQKELGIALGLEGKVGRADADVVKATTGFSIGGVPPIAHTSPLPIVIDASLWRYDTVHAAAGHPHCVFPESPDALARLTGGVVSDTIGEVADG